MGVDGFSSKPQELTLSYLCEGAGKVGLSQKGKQVMLLSDSSNQDDKWVERDFMNLNSSKRDAFHEEEINNDKCSREKRPKLETLNLSLALPDVSLSLTASNALQNNGGEAVIKLNPCKSANTQTTYSNDFTAAASLSYSYSHPLSHNPSCSLTRNSTENYDCSVGRDDQIWCGGEGTNGSVHSRFRPIGDGFVAFNNNSNNNHGMIQANRVANKDSCNNSLYRAASSDNISFFPSELPARLPRSEAYSGDSRRRDSENLRGLDGDDGGRVKKVSGLERILLEIVSESTPVVAQIMQEFTDETLELIKGYLKDLIVMPENREELLGLQSRLLKRSDLTKETLAKCRKDQLDILVSVKTGLASFISGKVKLPVDELMEIFLFMKCRNVNCKSILPVDDCDCQFCSSNKGFCSSCMCPVCMNFDCASNTCSWVGCDVCSHWCHAACGIQKNLIRPGPSLKGPSGTSEMQFHCIACNHASEMFGFVKDVFVCCARAWSHETLLKELECVRKIFKGSQDFKGKELHVKAEELLAKLDGNALSPSDACNVIIQFFNYATDFPPSGVSAKQLMPTEISLRKEALPTPPAPSFPPKYTLYGLNTPSGQHDSRPSSDLHRQNIKAALLTNLKIGDEFQFGNLANKDAFDSLETIVRIKEAEARMFQSKADEARKEAEDYRRMIRTKSEKLEEEYAEKLSKLCLQETKDRRRKKLEELKILENSHCDYYSMKQRMQTEIGGLLERMEATKQQLV